MLRAITLQRSCDNRKRWEHSTLLFSVVVVVFRPQQVSIIFSIWSSFSFFSFLTSSYNNNNTTHITSSCCLLFDFFLLFILFIFVIFVFHIKKKITFYFFTQHLWNWVSNERFEHTNKMRTWGKCKEGELDQRIRASRALYERYDVNSYLSSIPVCFIGKF